VARALRWQVMLRPFGRRVSVGKLTSDTAVGLTAVLLLGRVGEVVRPYLIAMQAGLALSSQAAAWLLERTLDLLAVLLFFGYALLRIHGRGFDPGAMFSAPSESPACSFCSPFVIHAVTLGSASSAV
jgi:uncharacterized membrane protein YbhN (UPF0104 family)